jgi:hypothetical protein
VACEQMRPANFAPFERTTKPSRRLKLAILTAPPQVEQDLMYCSDIIQASHACDPGSNPGTRIPYVFVGEISHSMLRNQNAGSAGGKTAAKTCKRHTKAYTLFVRFGKR